MAVSAQKIGTTAENLGSKKSGRGGPRPNSGGSRAGAGRPKGVPNKLTATVKECIEHAFKGVGGAEYLMRQAEQNPTAFMTLLGKVIPAQVHADITSGGKSLQQMQEAVLAALAKKHG